MVMHISSGQKSDTNSLLDEFLLWLACFLQVCSHFLANSANVGQIQDMTMPYQCSITLGNNKITFNRLSHMFVRVYNYILFVCLLVKKSSGIFIFANLHGEHRQCINLYIYTQ